MQIYGLRQRLPGRRLPRSAAGWIGANNAFDRLVRYLHTCVKYLISYGARWGQGQPFTSAGAESVVDCVNGQGLKRNGHMQWTRTRRQCHFAGAMCRIQRARHQKLSAVVSATSTDTEPRPSIADRSDLASDSGRSLPRQWRRQTGRCAAVGSTCFSRSGAALPKFTAATGSLRR